MNLTLSCICNYILWQFTCTAWVSARSLLSQLKYSVGGRGRDIHSLIYLVCSNWFYAMFSTWISGLFQWSRRVPGHPETEASKSTPSDSQWVTLSLQWGGLTNPRRDLADLTASVEKAFTYATAQGSIGDVWKCRWNGEDDNPEVRLLFILITFCLMIVQGCCQMRENWHSRRDFQGFRQQGGLI